MTNKAAFPDAIVFPDGTIRLVTRAAKSLAFSITNIGKLYLISTENAVPDYLSFDDTIPEMFEDAGFTLRWERQPVGHYRGKRRRWPKSNRPKEETVVDFLERVSKVWRENAMFRAYGRHRQHHQMMQNETERCENSQSLQKSHFMDNRSETLRSKTMAAVRQKDTGPEMVVRRLLHKLGYRYRLHAKELPGRPDIVFRPRRKVIFVHGCFWHGHGCEKGKLPKSKLDYWKPKINRNIERDRENVKVLRESGWDVLVVWQCDIEPERELKECLLQFMASSVVQGASP